MELFDRIKELCKEIITQDLDINKISIYNDDMIGLFNNRLYRRISSNDGYTSRLGYFSVWNRLFDPECVNSVIDFRDLFTYEPLKSKFESKCPEFNRPFISFGISDDSYSEYALNFSDTCYIDTFVFDDELWDLYKSKKKEISDALVDTVEDVICLDPFKPLEPDQISDIVDEIFRCGYDDCNCTIPVKGLIDCKFRYRVHVPKHYDDQRVRIYESLNVNNPKHRIVGRILGQLILLDKFLKAWHYDTTKSIEDVEMMAYEKITEFEIDMLCRYHDHAIHNIGACVTTIRFQALHENFDTIEVTSQRNENGLLYECLKVIRETCVSSYDDAYSIDYSLSKSPEHEFEINYIVYYNGEMTNPPIKDHILIPYSIMEELYQKHGITMSDESMEVDYTEEA